MYAKYREIKRISEADLVIERRWGGGFSFIIAFCLFSSSTAFLAILKYCSLESNKIQTEKLWNNVDKPCYLFHNITKVIANSEKVNIFSEEHHEKRDSMP